MTIHEASSGYFSTSLNTQVLSITGQYAKKPNKTNMQCECPANSWEGERQPSA